MRVPAIMLLALAAACGSSDSPTNPSGNKSVDVYTLPEAFSPNFVQINAGDTIQFVITPGSENQGHDVTFDAKAGAPANIKVTLNGTIPRVFTTRGTFHFNCFVHPGMSGDVVVQ